MLHITTIFLQTTLNELSVTKTHCKRHITLSIALNGRNVIGRNVIEVFDGR